MSFVDGFVLACPEANKDEYVAIATRVAGMLKQSGALHVTECWANDVPHGKVTDFYTATQAQEGEAIVFSWIIWPDKDTRNAGWAALMADESLRNQPQPFDGQRMFWGGFDVIVEA